MLCPPLAFHRFPPIALRFGRLCFRTPPGAEVQRSSRQRRNVLQRRAVLACVAVRSSRSIFCCSARAPSSTARTVADERCAERAAASIAFRAMTGISDRGWSARLRVSQRPARNAADSEDWDQVRFGRRGLDGNRVRRDIGDVVECRAEAAGGDVRGRGFRIPLGHNRRVRSHHPLLAECALTDCS